MKYILRFNNADGGISYAVDSLEKCISTLINKGFDKRYKVFAHYEGFYYDITDIIITCFAVFALDSFEKTIGGILC